MTFIGPDGDGIRQKQEECYDQCEQLRTYLVYHLEGVEHHPADQHPRIVISDSGLEIELGLLRELNNHLDTLSPVCTRLTAAEQRSVSCRSAGGAISENFHPGFKVTVVSNGGDEKQGIVRWTRDDPTGPDLQLL